MTETPGSGTDPKIQPQGAVFHLIGTSPNVSPREYFFINQQLWIARREAWLCAKREDALVNSGNNNVDRLHRSHAITAVTSALAFLEALVSATWQDAREAKPGAHTPYTEGISDTGMAIMRELWNVKEINLVERMSVLEKFRLALVCAGHESMAMGADPYQSAKLLVDLRNALVHYKPHAVGDAGAGMPNHLKKLVGGLRSKITPERENRQTITGWYPNKVLGAGCAEWAYESAIAFAKDWHKRMGLQYNFDERCLIPSEPFQVAD